MLNELVNMKQRSEENDFKALKWSTVVRGYRDLKGVLVGSILSIDAPVALKCSSFERKEVSGYQEAFPPDFKVWITGSQILLSFLLF